MGIRSLDSSTGEGRKSRGRSSRWETVSPGGDSLPPAQFSYPNLPVDITSLHLVSFLPVEDFFWLGLSEAASKLGVSTKTLRRLVLANEIPHYRIGKSNRIRFQAGDLEQYIANSRVERVARTG